MSEWQREKKEIAPSPHLHLDWNLINISWLHHTPAHLELWDHVLLRVIRDALVGEQSAGQVLLVVPLKHILFLHEAEQHHGLVQYRLHFLLCQLAKTKQNDAGYLHITHILPFPTFNNNISNMALLVWLIHGLVSNQNSLMVSLNPEQAGIFVTKN